MSEEKTDATKNPMTSAIATDMPKTERDVEAEAQSAEFVQTDPLIASGLGLIVVLGNDMRYVGKPVAQDPTAETAGGLTLHPKNTTFTGLQNVPFDRSIMVKDPTSGDFYFPAETCNSWMECEYNGVKLVPPLTPPAPPVRSKAKEDDARAKDDQKARDEAKAKEDEKNKAKR